MTELKKYIFQSQILHFNSERQNVKKKIPGSHIVGFKKNLFV